MTFPTAMLPAIGGCLNSNILFRCREGTQLHQQGLKAEQSSRIECLEAFFAGAASTSFLPLLRVSELLVDMIQ